MKWNLNKETHDLVWSVEPNWHSFHEASVIQRCMLKRFNTKTIADNWVVNMQTWQLRDQRYHQEISHTVSLSEQSTLSGFLREYESLTQKTLVYGLFYHFKKYKRIQGM